jgi:serine O-acetyltransferase
MSTDEMKSLATEFRADLDSHGAGEERSGESLPSRKAVGVICRRYLEILFPIYYLDGEGAAQGGREGRQLDDIRTLMVKQICAAVHLEYRRGGKPAPADLEAHAREIHQKLVPQLPELAHLLATDIQAAHDNDPAALSFEEILLGYPFIEAVTVQRFAHRLYLLGVPFVPRMMTEIAHNHTGIDIHPGASLGESFFIDHGTGVVIGQTSIIGNHVTLYHGVTLGAFNPLTKDETGHLRRGQSNKRHPTIEDHVTIYPYATILGGNTHIGHHSVIGGNVWLTKSVAPYSRVTVKDPELSIYNAGDQIWSPYSGI